MRRGVQRLQKLGVRSIAVMYLFSFVNPAHERRTREIILEEFPDVDHISLSHEVMPRGPEFERVSTTLVNAYVAPRIANYTDEPAGASCARAGYQRPAADHAVDRWRDAARLRRPARGHAARERARPAASWARRSRPRSAPGRRLRRRRHGRHELRHLPRARAAAPEIKTDWNWRYRYYIGLPMVDVQSVGAGGGSIARVRQGALLVGPESAGSVPGPVCYGRGGTHPTVTDADAVLGYLPGDGLRGRAHAARRRRGPRTRSAPRRRAARSRRDATRRGASSASSTPTWRTRRRKVLAGHGADPRDLSLIAYGGNGAVHARCDRTRARRRPHHGAEGGARVRARSVCSSPTTSSTSCRSYVTPLSQVDLGRVRDLMTDLIQEVDKELEPTGLARDRRRPHLLRADVLPGPELRHERAGARRHRARRTGPARSRRTVPRPARGRTRFLLPVAAAGAPRRAVDRAGLHAEARSLRRDRHGHRRDAASKGDARRVLGRGVRRDAGVRRHALGRGRRDRRARHSIEEPFTVVVLPPGAVGRARRVSATTSSRCDARRSSSSRISTGIGSGTGRSTSSAAGSSTRSTRCSICSTPIRGSGSCSTARRSCSTTTSRCGPTRATGSRGRARRAARGRAVVRAARLAAPGGRDARPQPVARPRDRRARSGRCRASRTCPTRSGIPRSSRNCSPASASTRSCTGAATAARSTRSRRVPLARARRQRSVRAWYLAEGYFGAGGLDADGDVAATVARLQAGDRAARRRGAGPVLLMNGFDHLPPDTSTGAVADAIGAQPRAARRRRRTRCRRDELARVVEGALVGARTTNLLPGVWSSRMPLKLRNRAVETLLTSWAEPWAAFGALSASPTNGPRSTRAWRTLLQNQAHDSIGGCSVDAVHERMAGPLRRRRGLGPRHGARVLERLAGRNLVARHAVARGAGVVVFNTSAEPRTDVVRVPLEGVPAVAHERESLRLPPAAMPTFAGVTVDGEPARVVASDDPDAGALPARRRRPRRRVRRRDVPAFGCRRFRSRRPTPSPDEVDDGREIDNGRARRAERRRHAVGHTRRAHLRGALRHRRLRRPRRLLRRRSRPAAGAACARVRAAHAARVGHRSGCASRASSRRSARSWSRRGRARRAVRALRGHARQPRARSPPAPALPDRRARRRRSTAATTFDTATAHDRARRRRRVGASARRARSSHQGWIAANGLVVGAPGLPEAEVTPAGDDPRHARAQRRHARPHRAADAPDAGRARDAGAGRAGAGPHRARPSRSPPRPSTRARPRSACGACSAATTRCSPTVRRCSSSTRARRVLSACKPAAGRRRHRRARAEPERRTRRRRRCASASTSPTRPRSGSTRHRPTTTSTQSTADVGPLSTVPPHALRSVRVQPCGDRCGPRAARIPR